MKDVIRRLVPLAVVLSAATVFAGTALPPEFPIGGWVPPDKDTAKAEVGVFKAIIKYTSKTNTCYYKAVKLLSLGKPVDLAGCLAKNVDKFDKSLESFALPACLDPTAVREASDDIREASVLPALYCEGPVDAGTGLAVPTTKEIATAETAIGKAYGKFVAAWDKCFDGAMRYVVAGLYDATTADALAACLTKASDKYGDALTKVFDQGDNPDCLTPTVAAEVTNLATYAVAYTDQIFCLEDPAP